MVHPTHGPVHITYPRLLLCVLVCTMVVIRTQNLHVKSEYRNQVANVYSTDLKIYEISFKSLEIFFSMNMKCVLCACIRE